jgi:heme oxygenase
MPLSASSVDLADYLSHLAVMRDWIGEFPEWPTKDLHLNEVAHVLTLDIAIADALLANPYSTRGAVVAARARESAEPSTAAAWGFAYVLHGSQLGNQVLYRRWLEVLAPHPLNYLRGAGSETPRRWKQFLASLAENVTTAQAMDESCAGAVAAFESLLRIVPQCAARRVRGSVRP